MSSFEKILDNISMIGVNHHKDDLIANAEINKIYYKNQLDISDLRKKNNHLAFIVSAGPSLVREATMERLKKCLIGNKKKVTIICIDASLIRLLKNDIIPDYCLVLDPHPTRLLRWFGDPLFELHSSSDDYFNRQDLDENFRKNSIEENMKNIELINKNAHKINLVPCISINPMLSERLKIAKFKKYYWWTPLVDNPFNSDSITKNLYKISGKSAMNTGGNVGAASWIFANSILNFEKIGVIGMDYSYYKDTKYINTQTYYELLEIARAEKNIKSFFKSSVGLGGKAFFQDPTYFWYCENLKEIIKKGNKPLYNCSDAGLLRGENIIEIAIEDFFI
jgi:hypothetical protein